MGENFVMGGSYQQMYRDAMKWLKKANTRIAELEAERDNWEEQCAISRGKQMEVYAKLAQVRAELGDWWNSTRSHRDIKERLDSILSETRQPIAVVKGWMTKGRTVFYDEDSQLAIYGTEDCMMGDTEAPVTVAVWKDTER
jgi:hypothetical protein